MTPSRHPRRLGGAGFMLALLALAGSAGTQAATSDPSTGHLDQGTPGVEPLALGGQLDFAGGRPRILWVETNGRLREYWSGREYANIVKAMAAKADLKVKRSGAITLNKLLPFDLVIVPSLANYRFPWSKAEYGAFHDYVEQGGTLYVWTDRPALPHVAVDPLLQIFGLSRYGTETASNVWDCVLPSHVNQKVEGMVGGHVGGGQEWLDDAGRSVGDFVDYGAGRVWLLGDGNVYAQRWNAAQNLEMMKVVVKDSLKC